MHPTQESYSLLRTEDLKDDENLLSEDGRSECEDQGSRLRSRFLHRGVFLPVLMVL